MSSSLISDDKKNKTGKSNTSKALTTIASKQKHWILLKYTPKYCGYTN